MKGPVDLSTTGDHRGIGFQADVLAESSLPGSLKQTKLLAGLPPTCSGRWAESGSAWHTPHTRSSPRSFLDRQQAVGTRDRRGGLRKQPWPFRGPHGTEALGLGG